MTATETSFKRLHRLRSLLQGIDGMVVRVGHQSCPCRAQLGLERAIARAGDDREGNRSSRQRDGQTTQPVERRR